MEQWIEMALEFQFMSSITENICYMDFIISALLYRNKYPWIYPWVLSEGLLCDRYLTGVIRKKMLSVPKAPRVLSDKVCTNREGEVSSVIGEFRPGLLKELSLN